MRSHYDAAIYSANIEESNIGQRESLRDVRATVIWEGHGLLSNLLRDQANDYITVTGQLSKAVGESFDYSIQVLLQLHPIHRSPSSESSPIGNQSQQQQQQQPSLPSMKSLFASDPIVYPPHPSSSSSLSPPIYQHPYEQQQHQHQQQQQPSVPTSHATRIPAFRPMTSSQPPLRCELDFIPPLASSSSYHSHPQHQQDSSDWSRHLNSTMHPHGEGNHQRLTPPLSTTPAHHHHQHTSPPPNPPSDSARSTSSLSVTPPPPPTSSTASFVTVIASSPLSGSKTRKAPSADTFYHQSRRKKRDTKPPNATDVRPFVEVDRDTNGRYILPVEVDSWTVLDLGNVVWDRVAFHNQRYLYPVGYCVKKWYRSMVDPHSDTQYTCQILDGGDEPIFQLEADDNPGEVWRGPTPTTVWTIAVRRAFAIRNMDYGHNPVGPDFFGLRKNTIAKMIQDLPNAGKCKNYIWQNFEAITTTGTKSKAMRRSNTRVSLSSSGTSTSSIGESSTATTANITMASS
ncbi:unnamed protein product [Absidia cylindrospora]